MIAVWIRFASVRSPSVDSRSLQVLRLDLLGRRQPEPELAQELPQRLEPVELRQPVHAVQRRHVMTVEQPRGGDVGRDHAFLDQPVRIVARLLDERSDRALLVELELELGRVELERTAPAARARKRLVYAVQRQQPLAQLLEPRVVPRVRPSRNSPTSRYVRRAAERITPSKKRERVMRPSSRTRSSQQRREPVLVGHERTESVRQRFRQHRQHAVRKVDRRAALARFAIERRARPHVVPDVGDRNDQPSSHRSRVRTRRRRRSRAHPRRRSSREPAARRSSRPAMALAGMRASVRLRFGEHLGAETRRQAVRVDRDLGFHSRRAVIAEHARDATDRLRIAAAAAA